MSSFIGGGTTTLSGGTADVVITGPVDDYGNLQVNINNPLKIGDSTSQTIDDTERVLDLTALAGGDGYPMEIELESQTIACYVKQGSSGVSLGVVNARIQADQWRRINVAGVEEAYIAVQNTLAGESGTLVATRIDVI